MESTQYLMPLAVIVLGWVTLGGSPGPATLTISGTAMAEGRRAGLLVAVGIVVGSACWGIAAALGLAAVMLANAWMFEVLRYLGAAYLFWLALKSLRSAWQGAAGTTPKAGQGGALFRKGLLLHLTNPKAILGWGSVYAIAVVPGAGAEAVWRLFVVLIAASCVVFFGYALLFSTPVIARTYGRSKRWFEAAFGLLFGAASLKILTLRLT